MVQRGIRVLSLISALSILLSGAAPVYAADPCVGCLIGFVCYADGSPNPSNSCLVCNITNSTSAWSFAPVETVCSDDGNTCTEDKCNNTGLCQHTEFEGIQSCDDSNACTQADFCFGTTCTGLTVDCNDQDPCTDDSCDTISGCAHLSNTGEVCEDDNNECTDDRCAAGVCTHEPFSSVVECDDNSVCTQFDFCLGGNCTGQPVSCADGNPCTNDTCDAIEGCKNPFNSAPCEEDADECSQDICSNGACTHPPATGTPCSPDTNPCTQDLCINGACTHFPGSTGENCEDGNLCTAGETCQEIGCTGGTVINCDDGLVCTDDGCSPSVGCQNTFNQAGCDDGNPCTSNDRCELGACTDTTPTICNDGDPCTNDSCNTFTGCTTTLNNANCPDDGDLCTNDFCVVGVCTHPSVPDGGSCDDSNVCTTDDTCQAGLCNGQSLDCDDVNPCTDDSCDPIAGCLHQTNTIACTDDNNFCTLDECQNSVCEHFPINEAQSCTDNNQCTILDKCVAGACIGNSIICNDSNECTDDSCDSTTGACSYTVNQAPCADDGNDCTSDNCQDSICVHTNNNLGDPCDDNDACTDQEVCITGGVCIGQPRECDDGNECTIDGCDNTTGGCTAANFDGACSDDGDPCTSDLCQGGACTHPPGNDGTSCDDNDVCTIGDKCGVGACAGFGITCNDFNPCTNDSCDSISGCVFISNSLPCPDDGDACTVDVCSNDTCTHSAGNDGVACDDGTSCTETDVCGGGTCQGTAIVCEDNDPCTNNLCGATTGCDFPLNTAPCADDGNECTEDRCTEGDCTHTPWTEALFCDDGDACSFLDICANITCTGFPVVCDDDDPCTDDQCVSPTGCEYTANSAPCDDGNFCTSDDTCNSGNCQGTQTLCDDANPCTDDSCDAAQGCTTTVNTAVCDDGNECTTGDKCANGVCVGMPSSCDDNDPCTADSCANGTCVHTSAQDGVVCDDNSLCTSFDFCVKGECHGLQLECDDSNPCTENTCVDSAGCTYVPITGTSCDDNNPCTGNDTCNGGTCAGGSGSGGAITCDDNDPCTDDSCVPATGCQYTNNTAPCNDDGNDCTADVCSNGACTHTGVENNTPCTDDGNPCTGDICVLGACAHPVASSNTCDDGDPCTTQDFCIGVACTGLPTDCDDDNNCTNDSCVPGIGCSSLPNTNYCDDDNNPCTKDICNAGACTHIPDFEFFPCDDATLCTVNDQCQGGLCVGSPKACDDGNACTTDSCDPVAGCVTSPATASCEDGDFCTVDDSCKDGSCVGGPPKFCTSEDDCHLVGVCNSTTATCDFTVKSDDTPCDDGSVCTTGTTCQQGECTPTDTDDCDDGNVCTTDTCHPTQGCAHWQHTDACDDGDACTSGDSCLNGICQAGSSTDCDDGLDCTADSCDSSTGCTHTPNHVACSDNDPCTTDTCALDTGCQSAPFIGPCDDDNQCTEGDTCANGLCAGAEMVVCDDANPCTDDGCANDTGCLYIDNGNTCNDNNPCTTNDTCVAGACTSMGATVCDDGNPCTDDYCDTTEGCKTTFNIITTPCYEGPSGTENVGVCTAGTHTCEAGALGSCVADITPGLEYCGNNIDDDCDGNVDETNACVPSVTPTGDADVRISLVPGSAGLLDGTVVDAGSGFYQQAMGAFMHETTQPTGTVRAVLGTLESTRSYTTQTKPAVWIQNTVRTPELYADQPDVRVSVQVRDAVGRPRVLPGTTATLHVTLTDQEVTGSCVVDTLGTCDVSTTIPQSWFQPNVPVDVSATVTTNSAASTTQEITLHPAPGMGLEPDQPTVIVQAPYGPRPAGGTIEVPIYAVTSGAVLESFDVTVSFDPTLLEATDVALDPAFTGTAHIEGNTMKAVGIREDGASDEDVTGTVLIATVTLHVSETANAGQTGWIKGHVNNLFDAQQANLANDTPAVVHDSTGASLFGKITVSTNPIRGIVAIALHTDLFNTAVLTDSKVTVPIIVRTIRTHGPDLEVTGVCQSDNADALVIGPGCVATLTGAQTQGDDHVFVSITYGGHTNKVPFRVWYPTDITVSLQDDFLQAIAGVQQSCDDPTSPRYQSTNVHATATFQAGSILAVTGRVDHLMSFKTADPGVATINGTSVRAQQPGTTFVQAINASGVVAYTVVSVSNDSPVSIDDFYLVVATDISIKPLSPPPPFGLDVDTNAQATATLNQVLNSDGAQATVLAYAKLSDGKRMAVTPEDGLWVSSLNTGIVSAGNTPPTVTAVGSGSGEIVQGTWTLCGQETHSATAWVTTSVPKPVDASIAMLSTPLAYNPTGPAAQVDVPTSSDLVVTVELENGETVDGTLDSRTHYDDVSGDPNDLFTVQVVTDQKGQPSSVVVTPTGTSAGTAMLNVTFEHAPGLTASVPVTLVETSKMILIAHPYPAYPGSSAILTTTLSAIENTDQWQSAEIELVLHLSDGSSMDISEHKNVLYAPFESGTMVPTQKVLFYDHNHVRGDTPGNVELRANVGGVWSTPYALEVISAPVTVASITVTLPPTLNGVKDVATFQTKVSATLSDASILEDALTLAGLIVFDSSDPAVASVDGAGVVVLHDNHNALVTITATVEASGVSGGVDVACNLSPAVGDVDLGQLEFLAHPDVNPGELFEMPVRVNTGGEPLGAFDMTIEFDPAVIIPIAVNPGADWPGGHLDANMDESPGTVQVVGAADVDTVLTGNASHIVTISFKALKDGDTTTTLVSGDIRALVENSIGQTSIGAPILPGDAPRPIVAGRGLLDPDCPNGAQPDDVLGNANGDCGFSAADVSTVLFYLADLIPSKAVSEAQLTAMDADKNGVVEVSDAVYLLRVLSDKYRFVDVSVTPPDGIDGTVMLTAALTDKTGQPKTDKTNVYFEIDTQADPAQLTFAAGTLVEPTENGIVVAAANQDDGTYVVHVSGFTAMESDVGVGVVVESLNAVGDTSNDRRVALHGSPWINENSPYLPAAYFNITDGLPQSPCSDDGECDNATNAASICTEGVCVAACSEGFVDVDGDLASGPSGTGCECESGPEWCDHTDNDCDGVVDNGFPDKGIPCSAGEGTCAQTGTVDCRADGTATECLAQPLADDSPCDDDAACTVNDVCTDGVCTGSAMVCDSGSLCADGACIDSQCVSCQSDADCGEGAVCEETATGWMCFRTCDDSSCAADEEECVERIDGALRCVSVDETDPCRPLDLPAIADDADAGDITSGPELYPAPPGEGCGCRVTAPASSGLPWGAMILFVMLALSTVVLRRRLTRVPIRKRPRPTDRP